MKRILVTIPHYYGADGGGSHGSTQAKPATRLLALTRCLSSLVGTYGESQEFWVRDGDRLRPIAANQPQSYQLDIVICTTGDQHLLDELPLQLESVRVHQSTCEAHHLGYQCHRILADHVGSYDLFCYLEDDLVLHDPEFFRKIAVFNTISGDGAVLQPNRYELSVTRSQVKRVYIDFEFRTEADNHPESETVELKAHQDAPVLCRRTSNPHAGCFFLNRKQLENWANRPYFLDRSAAFVGPLESAATLGLMKTFRVYKPAPDNASFLEIEHHGQSWSRKLSRVRVPIRNNS